MFLIAHRFNKVITCLMIIAVTASCSRSEGKDMSVLRKSPLFLLTVESSDVRAFVEVNGVYVHTIKSQSGSSKVELPVNHYFTPDRNTIGITIFPLRSGEVRSPNASVSVALSVKSDETGEGPYEVASLNYSAKQNDLVEYNGGNVPITLSSVYGFESRQEGDVTIFPARIGESKGIKILRSIDIPSNLPEWGFLEGEDLPNYYQISEHQYYKDRDALYEIYKSIEQSLYNGDVDFVLDLFEERNNETDQAFYMESGETREGLKRSLQRSIDNDKLELLTSDETAFILKPEPGRKLVSLVRSDKRGAIAFNFIGEEGSVRYDLVFRKKDGEWIISR